MFIIMYIYLLNGKLPQSAKTQSKEKMKKTFELYATKHKPARMADKIKNEIKKYISRERKKEVPSNIDFWDFDCRIGDTEETAKKVHLNDISKSIDTFVAKEAKSFYMEILSRPGFRPAKSKE